MLYGDDTELTDAIIGCAIEVHRGLGPGLLESGYEAALCAEMEHRGITFARQGERFAVLRRKGHLGTPDCC